MVLDIAVEPGILAVVQLVSVSVSLAWAGAVASLGAAGDGQRTGARALEHDGVVNGAGEDSLQRGAARVVLVAASAAGRDADARVAELSGSRGVRHRRTTGGGQAEDGGENGELKMMKHFFSSKDRYERRPLEQAYLHNYV